jgi:formylglycine-generating enzyme required for sulfatase activity/tRNA A-37 threonylcarbamoyl transferase component Bud32
MPNPHADRNLLFGILALQMDFISRDALIAAMHTWVLDKGRPLGQVLRQQGALSEEHLALLEAMVQAHIRQHANDPQQSLAAVSSLRSVREDLRQLADADVQASLLHVSADRPEVDPNATSAEVAGGSTGAEVAGGSTGALARFRILRPHAKGGLGEIFVARDEELNRDVALKEIQKRHASQPESRARFLLEAEVTGQLEHPGIVPVYGLGSYADGRPFYAMRFVQGDSLKDAITAFHRAEQAGQSASARSLGLRQLLGRFVDVCQAIAYAHSRGVLHRDLKPGNIMLGKYGETLVVDWGLAKVLGKAEVETTEGALARSGDSTLTQTGRALGTPAYMSPEQAAGRLDQLGPHSDVYSLGATLYCLLTGQAPVAEADVETFLQKVQKGDFPPPRQVHRRVPAALEAVCLKAMALKPEERYATPRELAEEIERWLADESIAAYREPFLARAGRWVRKHPARTAAVGALLLTGVIALGVSTLLIGRAQQETAEALQKEEQARRDRVLAQVNALGDAEAAAVPAILADLADNHEEVLPRLREMWQQGNPQRKRMRAALALLPVEPETVRDTLADYLLRLDDPAEIVLIRNTLAPHAAALKETLWARVADTKGPPLERFHALIALAAFDAKGKRWEKQADVAVAQMLSENPLHLGTWVQALSPVRESLLGPLSKVYREAKSPERREVAATVLADYTADKPNMLANLLLDADPKQYAILFPVLQSYREQAVARMRRELAQRPEGNDLPLPKWEEREQVARRQATAAVTLLKLDAPEDAWPLYRHRDDPEARSQLIWRGGLLGLDPRKLVQRLDEEKNVSAQRALIVALGEFSGEQLPQKVRGPLVEKLLKMYRDHPDPGIHGAIDWLLRHGKEGPVDRPLDWGQAQALQQIDEELKQRDREVARGGRTPAEGRRWYVNGQGQTMVLVPGPVEVRMGSPPSDPDRVEGTDDLHRRHIPRRYALASRSVTVAEFQRFLKEWPDVRHDYPKRYSPEVDGPIISVTWFEAAQYCNWLSETEGLDKKEWCYPNHADIKDGMKLQADFLRRKGYRLPTEAEWEFACRAEAETSRYYGSSVELLPRYGWFLANGQDRAWSVGQKRPNDLGLFDMHGNVFNWVADPGSRYPQGVGTKATVDDADLYGGHMIFISDSKSSRVLRGGSFFSHASGVRSAHRVDYRPAYRINEIGFRPARTVSNDGPP